MYRLNLRFHVTIDRCVMIIYIPCTYDLPLLKDSVQIVHTEHTARHLRQMNSDR